MSARIRGVTRERQIAIAGVLLGPSLLVAGLAVGTNTDGVERFIPLSRAWIGGAIALPLLVLAPGALSLAWLDWDVARAGKLLASALSIGLALLIVAWGTGSGGRIGCQPITDPMQALPAAGGLGVVVGLGFFLAIAVGAWFAASERPRAAIAAAAGVGVLSLVADYVAYVLLFMPGVSCAIPQGVPS
jgi:hypothetical protein